MTRRSRRRYRKDNNNAIYITCICLIIPVIIAFAILLIKLTGEEKLDENYCVKRDDQHITAIFIDNSLKYQSEAQFRDYQRSIEHAWYELPANGKLFIFTTARGDDGALAKPVISICKPARNQSEQEILGLKEKPLAYLKNQKKKAKSIFDQAVRNIIIAAKSDDKRAKDSLILEQIRSISMHRDFKNTKSGSLYFISDGIQNSEIARFCTIKNQMPPFKNFVKRDDYTLRIKPKSFANIDVQIMLLDMHLILNFCNNTEIQRWWLDYFKENNAKSVTLNPIRKGL